ncbi:hypothetical protein [Nitrosospira multiformis]|nr:hypothetical protein [Nitrosospira multiformis]
MLSLISGNVFASQFEGYDELDKKFRQKIIEIEPGKDPRSDSDQLRPVMNYDVEIIQFHNFKKAKSGQVGEGWQLGGSIVDVLVHEGSQYILYGRENMYYRAGLWNNVLDTEHSYQDYLVVRHEGNQSEIIKRDRLIPTTSEIRIGLRKTNNGNGFEVIQNSPSGQLKVIWLYHF